MVRQTATIRDLLLPIVVVAVVGMMIFPLPVLVLDNLLMLNIAFSLALIVACVYLAEPEKFTSLPTILLLSTLFRLGLNISTTRQILTYGEAPCIVVTFGNFVVNGNLVVGAVIFLIVTIIQFLVVAKGSERVAEVAARFTLDAMPGKQMAIDADIRAGLLSLLDAKEKRIQLQSESKLYGALDGAMKFIKGDCIAGLLIAVVNISAGLVVGLVYQKLTLGQAIEKFTLYTIGDGLCSQIPALLVAVSAGIVVTRVADRDGNFLSRDIISQLTQEPQALAATGGMLLLLAFVPGFPKLTLISIALLLFSGAVVSRRARDEEFAQGHQGISQPQTLSTLSVKLSVQVALAVQSEKMLAELLRKIKSDTFENRGIIVPEVQFEIDSQYQQDEFSLLHNGVLVKNVALSKYSATSCISEVLALTVSDFIADSLSELVDDTQVRSLLDLHAPVCEDLINSVIPSVLSVTGLTQLLRTLVSEQVSVRAIPRILQVLAEYRQEKEHGYLPYSSSRVFPRAIKEQVRTVQQAHGIEASMSEILADIRVALGNSICMDLSDDGMTIRGWMLDPDLDRDMTNRAMVNGQISSDLIQAVSVIMENLPRSEQNQGDYPLIVITSRYARPILSGIAMSSSLNLRALAIEEIHTSFKLNIQGNFCFLENECEDKIEERCGLYEQ